MSLDNFVVRPHRRVVERFGDESRLDAIRGEGGLGLFFRKLLGARPSRCEGRVQRTCRPLHTLYESPFTDVSDQGLSGVFPAERSVEVTEIVRRIRATAAA